MPGRKDLQRDIYGSMVTGYGITVPGHISMDLVTGQDHDIIVLMKPVVGRADPRERFGSEDTGRKKMKEVQIVISGVTNEIKTKQAALLTATGIVIINN
jgi:hypothetical protein